MPAGKRLRILIMAILIHGMVLSAVNAAEPGLQAGDFPQPTLKYSAPEKETGIKRIHPDIRLLDHNRQPVITSRKALSLRNTCGECHDTAYIHDHNYHALVGLDEIQPAGQSPSGRAWDISPGLFGRWDPLTYRVLTPASANPLDMGTADWIMTMGARHAGGGPAEFSRYGDQRLIGSGYPAEAYPETHVIDPVSGKVMPWDWKTSGTVELNCLLCHIKNPNNIARIQALKRGQFRWASTATLVDSGLVLAREDHYEWVTDTMEPDGKLSAEHLQIRDPKSANCRMCHAKSCRCTDPVVFENSLENWSAETTGEIFSPERMFDSGMNLKSKSSLSRAWDVHAQRLFECVHCHYSMNNPKYSEKEFRASKPRHLKFDSRRLGGNDYLLAPDHNLAKGHSAQGTVARKLDGTMRNCRDCHDALATHSFLPYKQVHFEKLSCQVCHIPRVFAPARSLTDWTVLRPDGQPVIAHRGVEGRVNDPASLIEGYRPALLLHETSDDRHRLAPSNLMVSWFWIEGDPGQPVRRNVLQNAFFSSEGKYHPDIIQALDEDNNQTLSEAELQLDTPDKVAAIASRLEQFGATSPRIRGEIQPYTLSHGIASGDFVMKSCQDCHSRRSRIIREIQLAAYVPGSILPEMVKDARTQMIGELRTGSEGELVFKPALDPETLYIHGSLHPQWLDILGIITVIGSILGTLFHGVLRLIMARKRNKETFP